MIRTLPILAVVLAVAACGKPAEQTPAVAAQKEALDKVAAMNGAGAASDSPACKLFTAAEVGAYVGTSLGAGEKAAMGSGCQWSAGDGSVNGMVQIIPKSYAEYPTNDPSYRKLANISADAYAAEDLVGWKAGALDGESFVIVSVAGPKASPETVAAFLKDALARHN